MGSGKSTVGPILANSIAYDFVDLDAAIERIEGRSISEIFRLHGERYFRQREREELIRMCVPTRLVIALGGGTLVQPETYRFIRASGLLVYLRLSPEELYRRVRHKDDRPLLTDAEGRRLRPEELKARIQTLYHERETLYASADITVESDIRRVGVTADRVARELASRLR
jgi:shikimate kinase